jgi:hypothetical protein
MTQARKKFSDPHGTQQPAFEQNLVKHRAFQMLLAIFYAEELKRGVLRLKLFPKGTKKLLDKSLQQLASQNELTAAEKAEIVELIDHRNDIAHQMHDLFVDLSPNVFVRGFAPFRRKHKEDGTARLRYFLDRLDKICASRVTELSMDRYFFSFAESTLLGEIARLEKKLKILFVGRSSALKGVNSELSSLKVEGFVDELDPRHPLNHYDNNRLTRRGEEVCYRLFDIGKSPMTIAHAMNLSITAARHRGRLWSANGGNQRVKLDIASLPMRKFYNLNDD